MRGISVNIKSSKKPKKTGDDFIDELNLKGFNRDRKDFLFTLRNLLDPKRLLKFVEDNSKKTEMKFDKREIVGFMQLVITQQYKTDKIVKEFKKIN